MSHKTDQFREDPRFPRGALTQGGPNLLFCQIPSKLHQNEENRTGGGRASNTLLGKSRSRSTTDAAKGTCVDFSPHPVPGSATEQCPHSYKSSGAKHCFFVMQQRRIWGGTFTWSEFSLVYKKGKM